MNSIEVTSSINDIIIVNIRATTEGYANKLWHEFASHLFQMPYFKLVKQFKLTLNQLNKLVYFSITLTALALKLADDRCFRSLNFRFVY